MLAALCTCDVGSTVYCNVGSTVYCNVGSTVYCNVGSTVYLGCLVFMSAVTKRGSSSCCVFISAQSGNFSIDHDTKGSHPHCTYPLFSALRPDSLQECWPLKQVVNSYKCALYTRSTVYTHVEAGSFEVVNYGCCFHEPLHGWHTERDESSRVESSLVEPC
jgi:hypothetical protein